MRSPVTPTPAPQIIAPKITDPLPLVDALEDERRTLIDYLWMKTRVEDWHGVADAACDLREVDAKLAVLRGA